MECSGWNSGKEGVIFHWTIEPFSCLWHKIGEKLGSPVFMADSIEKTKWCLWLYPNGDLSETYVGLYLQRLQNSEGPGSIAIHYELSFISNHSALQSSVTLEDIFEKGQSKGKREFIEQEKVLDSKHFPKDNLTVMCRIWKNNRRKKWTKIGKEMEPEEKVERISYFARTILKVENRYLVWSIEKFSCFKLSERNTLVIMSSSDEKLMTLEFYLTEHCCEELMNICISYYDPSIKYFKFNSHLLDTTGNKIECSYQEYSNEFKEGMNFLLFPGKVNLREEKHLYLPNDALSLHCECVFSMGIAFEGIVKTDRGLASTSLRNPIVEIKQVDASDALKCDLKSMYDQRLFCDVKLRTKTESFQAHRNILSVRSPVFRSMFTTTKEISKECVVLTDLEADIMRKMLLYLYTDTLEDLKWESASQLYVASNKYQILSLKECCSTFLVTNFTISNVCEVLILADMHQDKDLKKVAQDYIIKHDKTIFRSKEWRLLIDTHTKLVAETMHLKYCSD